jgi:hypothetical protein
MTVTPGPRTSAKTDPSGGARLEYRLLRDAVVRDVERGRLSRVDVCDAHPELLRAARNVGVPTNEECPICKRDRTVAVTFVFGPRLPPGGRCPGSAAELRRLCRRTEPVVCYAVEVCPGCSWHHLIRRYSAGGQAAASRRQAGRRA